MSPFAILGILARSFLHALAHRHIAALQGILVFVCGHRQAIIVFVRSVLSLVSRRPRFPTPSEIRVPSYLPLTRPGIPMTALSWLALLAVTLRQGVTLSTTPLMMGVVRTDEQLAPVPPGLLSTMQMRTLGLLVGRIVIKEVIPPQLLLSWWLTPSRLDALDPLLTWQFVIQVCLLLFRALLVILHLTTRWTVPSVSLSTIRWWMPVFILLTIPLPRLATPLIIRGAMRQLLPMVVETVA